MPRSARSRARGFRRRTVKYIRYRMPLHAARDVNARAWCRPLRDGQVLTWVRVPITDPRINIIHVSCPSSTFSLSCEAGSVPPIATASLEAFATVGESKKKSRDHSIVRKLKSSATAEPNHSNRCTSSTCGGETTTNGTNSDQTAPQCIDTTCQTGTVRSPRFA
jgi:hypothetical protein